MKKILGLLFLFFIISSCSNNENNSLQYKHNDADTIDDFNKVNINNEIKNQKKIDENQKKENKDKENKIDNNVLNSSVQTNNKEINDSEEINFSILNREEQKKIIKNINCEKFKLGNAKKECLYAKNDIMIDDFEKLSDEEKKNFDCNLMKSKYLIKYPALKLSFDVCIDEKKNVIKRQKNKELRYKIENGNLSYCKDISVIKKPGYSLDDCKIGVIAKSNKDCSILENRLQNDCIELKNFLFEQKRLQEDKNRKRKILNLLNFIGDGPK